MQLQGEGEVKVSKGRLSDGKKGNLETINLMIKAARACAADPYIRMYAIGILNQYKTDSQNYIDEALAIGDYVKKHVRYVRDPDGIELLTDPKTMIDMLNRGIARGDCDDMSLLIATLLLSIGHSPFYRAVRYDDSYGHFNHIYVVCYEKNLGKPRTRIALDAIIKQKPIGFEVPHKSGQEFAV